MALTTQLMQCASWLLTQRAVSEGDMKPGEAAEERYRMTPVQAQAGRLVGRGRSLPAAPGRSRDARPRFA
jgi:hypothetical protein